MNNEEKIKSIEKHLIDKYGKPLYCEYGAKDDKGETVVMKFRTFEVKVQFK